MYDLNNSVGSAVKEQELNSDISQVKMFDNSILQRTNEMNINDNSSLTHDDSHNK